MRLHLQPPILGELFPALRHIEVPGSGEILRECLGWTDPGDRPSEAEIRSFGVIALEGRIPVPYPLHRRAPTPERVREGRFNATADASVLDRKTYAEGYAVNPAENNLACHADGWLEPFTHATIGPTAAKDGLKGGLLQVVANAKKVAQEEIRCDRSTSQASFDSESH